MIKKSLPIPVLILMIAATSTGFELPAHKSEAARSVMISIAECKFEQSKAGIDSLISADSSDPLGWMLLLAETSLQQLDYNRPEEPDSFQALYDRTKTVMNDYEKRIGKDSYFLTIKGIMQMIATAYTMHRKKYWSAMKMGFDALDLCKEAKKIDSSNVDADFVIGLYNYARAELKRKFLGILFWYSGDKQSGIRMLDSCRRSAKLIALVADMNLQEIYVKEGMHEKAASGIQRLLAAYPGNRFVLWTKAKSFDARKMPGQAAEVYRALAEPYKIIPAAKNNYRATRYLEAKRFFEAKNADRAIIACDELVSACRDSEDDICEKATELSEQLHREVKP